MEKKDTLSSCSDSEIQQMQLIQDKSKESCMVSFQQLHSHLKCLSNNDLKGSRTEGGFKRAFATLFGQDLETFTGTMFLYMDQLQKQLDNEDFQEIGSMSAFKVLQTQFQMFIKSRFYLDDEHVDMTRNKFLQYTRLDIPEFRNTLIQHMESVKKSIGERAQHKMQISLTNVKANKLLMSVQNSEFKTTAMNYQFKAGSTVVPLAVKTATSRQELELLFHHHIAMLRTTGSKERSPPHNLRQKPGQYICCQNHKLIADIENDIMDPVMQCTTLPSHSGFSQQKLVSFVTEIHTLSIDISLRDC
ncbi:hypothetical protein Tco_0913550 [Tanacetum coccineum]